MEAAHTRTSGSPSGAPHPAIRSLTSDAAITHPGASSGGPNGSDLEANMDSVSNQTLLVAFAFSKAKYIAFKFYELSMH